MRVAQQVRSCPSSGLGSSSLSQMIYIEKRLNSGFCVCIRQGLFLYALSQQQGLGQIVQPEIQRSME
jgi:hypothetical protein